MSEEKKWFVVLCKIFGRIKLPLPKNLVERYEEEIKFLDLNLKPEEIFSASIFFSIFIFSVMVLFSVFVNVFSADLVFSFLLLSGVLLYFLLNYTSFFSKYLRARASSEIVLSIVYMAISMRISQNLEKAVEFVASNLSGPLGRDFKKALFNIKTGKSYSIKEELTKIADKWKLESQEFADAINILKESTETTKEELEKNLREAIDIVMNGTKRRMKEYALRMKTPITIVNAFGILMPLLLMIFLPVGMIFLPGAFKHATITATYTIVLPSIVYMFLLQNFYSRPYSYHQVTINLTENYKKRKKIIALTVSVFFLIFLFLLLKGLITSTNLDVKFLYSIGITNLIGLSIVVYIYLLSLGFERISEKIIKYEEELPSALYQISIEASTGKPLEIVLESIALHTASLKISEFFKMLSSSLKTRVINLKEALFDEKKGILINYPSRILASCMKAIVDISEKGSYFVSETLKSISSYLDNAVEVNKFTDEVLSETTSEMKITSYIFAPVAGGMIVGLMSVLVFVFALFQPQLTQSLKGIPQQQLSEILGTIGWLLKLNEQMSLEYFQIVIGVYVIEVTLILSWFLAEVSYGEDEIRKLRDVMKFIWISLLIYNLVSLSIYGIIRYLLATMQTF